MTTPAAGAISIGNVRTELGAAGALSMTATNFRYLLHDLAGAISMSSGYSKTRQRMAAQSVAGGGGTITGFSISLPGSTMSPGTIGGMTINELFDNNVPGDVHLRFAVTPPGQPQNAFTQFIINGTVITSASASSFNPNHLGVSEWRWSGVILGLVGGGTNYDFFFS